MTARKQIWDGTIPVRVILAANETRNRRSVDYLLRARRCSYLPLYLPQILKYFARLLNDPEDSQSWNWWFEFEQVPVRWNWPIGLSFDIMTGYDPSNTAENSLSHLPWTLTLHRKDYPADYILKLEDEQTVMDYWLNQTKAACCMRDGNSRAILNLSKSDTISFWNSVKHHSFDEYWSFVDRLFSNKSEIKYLPVKVYLPGGNRVVHLTTSSYSGDLPTTLGMALSENFPDLFPSKRTCILARPLVHGVILALSTPLLELVQEAMFPDGYLHVGVVMMC